MFRKQSITPKHDILLALGGFVIAFTLWQFPIVSPIVYPLRLFVTFIHELGHGTAALATGGEFLNFEVMSNGAGLAYSRGGVRPIIIAAGYMGTAIFGAILLIIANKLQQPQRTSMGLGGAFIGLTLFYSGMGLGNVNLLEGGLGLGIVLGGLYILFTVPKGRYLAIAAIGGGGLLIFYFSAGDNALTVIVGILWGIGLILLGYFANRNLNLFTLNFLAFAVGLNAITDAWVLFQIISSSERVPANDAVSMAEVTALPAIFWAMFWIGFAAILLGSVTWWIFVRPIRRSQIS